MGTTLEGKKVKDTYKSLVKVTDNSEAGSTGKQLSDGAGNDLGIYVDTDGVLGVGAAATAAIDASTKTDAIIVPNGTDAQQPSGTNGMIRFNTTNTKMEFYDGAWKDFGNIADDAVDHDQLADRYTERTDLGSGSSFAIDFSGASIYEVTANANATLTFSNAKQGQVVDIITDGNFTITFAETGSTFNQVGDGTYDGSTNNLVQVICTDDASGSKVYHYSVATFTSSASA
jgi:hypothetical protein